MSARSRTGGLEAALPVVVAVVSWLDRAHGFGSTEAYLGEQAGLPLASWDIAKLLRQVRTDVERTLTHRSRATVNMAVWKAVRAAALRVELALLLEDQTRGEQRVQLLEEDVLLIYGHSLLEGPEVAARPPVDEEAGRADLHAVMRARFVFGARNFLIALFTAAEARALIERRYFGAYAVLFPETAALDGRLVASAISLVETAELVASDGPLRAGPGTNDLKIPELRLSILKEMARAGAPAEATRLVETAKISALRTLGDGDRAGWLAERLVRSTYGSAPTTMPPT